LGAQRHCGKHDNYRKGAKAQSSSPEYWFFFAPLRGCGINHRQDAGKVEVYGDQNILDAVCLRVNRLALECILSPD
jgi:hypothetical protein